MKIVSILFLLMMYSVTQKAQIPDSAIVKKDSVSSRIQTFLLGGQDSTFQRILDQNNLLNSSGTPVSMIVSLKKGHPKDNLFYLLSGILLFLALIRFFFQRYFSNLLRVFFNTSLRQSQLTDQLLQARLPSLLFNMFFIICGGLFIYLLLVNYHWVSGMNMWLVIISSIALLGLIYFLKYCLLKFTGWVTGYREETNTYIFIFFLINKIMGIFLVPVIILMSFADTAIITVTIPVAMILIGLFLVLRFIRSFGLVRNQLKVSRFHFFIYILGMEILPLLLIYKTLLILLNKNL